MNEAQEQFIKSKILELLADQEKKDLIVVKEEKIETKDKTV